MTHQQRLTGLFIALFVLCLPAFSFGLTATGGTMSQFTNASGLFVVHTFTGNGTFNVTAGSGNVTVLIVAGGGGGGFDRAAGGGAGGLILNGSYPVSAGTNITVVVGMGGLGRLSGSGTILPKNGENSSFGVHIAIGGGRAGTANDTAVQAAGNGGSGGGGYGQTVLNGGTGTTGQGNSGGNGSGSVPYSSGGGGGYLGAGQNGQASTGGIGGPGINLSLNGSQTCFAGGGGGAIDSQTANRTGGQGGCGTVGGGKGGDQGQHGQAGVNTTGNGGGGGGNFGQGGGGRGGNGVVMVVYAVDLSAPVLSVTLNDTFTGNLVSGWCLLATGTNTTQNLCNATGQIITFNTTGVYNITAYNITSGNATPQWFNVTESNYVFNVTGGLVLQTVQAYLLVTPYTKYTSVVINQSNVTNGGYRNTTGPAPFLVIARNGSNNVKIDTPGNYSLNGTCVAIALTTQYCNITGVYDNVFTIRSNFQGTPITTFSINATNSALGLSNYSSTTNGTISFLLLQGYEYNFFIDAPGYTNQNITLSANSSANEYNFSLLVSRQLTFLFRDEITRAIINSTNMTLELISDIYATNLTTTNGSIINTLPFPAEYTFRYRGGNYTERQYFLNVTNNTNQNLTLYVIELDAAELVTVTVSDTGANLLEGATVKLLRYFLYCNCYEIVEMERTSFEGTTALWVQPIEGHYKWAIDYEGVNYFISTSPEIITVDTKFFSIDIGQGYYTSYQALTTLGTTILLNATSGVISYTWSDPSGDVTDACITTYRYIGLVETQYSQSCGTGATGGVITTINVSDGRTYKYVATVNMSSAYGYHVIATGFYDPAYEYDFGTLGAWLSLIVLVLIALIFSYSPTAILVGTAVVILVVNALGLLSFSTSFIAGIVSVILGMVVFLMRN